MSTKIYNGYKLKEPVSLSELHSFCMRLRQKVTPVAKTLYFKFFLKSYFEIIDKNIYGIYDESMYFIKEEGDVYYGLDRYIQKRMENIKITNERDPDVDFGFSINIHPLKDKEVLLLLYTEKKDLREAFESMPEVVDYHYQNQTDKPSKISKKAWEKRRVDWNAVLGGDGWGTPLENGFGYTPYILERFNMVFLENDEKEMLKNLTPTKTERAEGIARILHMEKWDKEHPIDPTIKDLKDNDALYRARMDNYWAFNAYTKTEAGQSERKNITNNVKSELVSINMSDLMNLHAKINYHENILKILNNEKGGKPYWYHGK